MHSDGSDPRQENSGKGIGEAVPANVVAHKDTKSALYVVQEYAEAIVQTMPDALLVLDTDLRVKFANDALRASEESLPSITSISGIELVVAIRQQYPEVRCIMLSGHHEHVYVRRALAAGAQGYVLKENPLDLIAALRAVLAGETYLSAELRP